MCAPQFGAEEALRQVRWLYIRIRTCGMTPSHVWQGSFLCVTRRIHVCDVTYLRVYLSLEQKRRWVRHVRFTHSLVMKMASSVQVICRLFCGYIGLLCGYTRLFCGYIRLFFGYVGLFCGNMGLSCGHVGLFLGALALYIGV